MSLESLLNLDPLPINDPTLVRYGECTICKERRFINKTSELCKPSFLSADKVLRCIHHKDFEKLYTGYIAWHDTTTNKLAEIWLVCDPCYEAQGNNINISDFLREVQEV